MNYVNQQSVISFDRAGQFFADRPFTPPIPLATALFTELATVATAMRDKGAIQATAFTGFRGGTDARAFAFNLILDDMRVLNKIAKGLPVAEFPELREHFRMPRSRSYAHIAAQGRAFATNAAENEAAFTDRGLPAGFIAAFGAKVTAAEAAVESRDAGIIDRAGATAGLRVKARRGVEILRELDGIMAVAYMGDPEVLAAWRTARHIARRTSSPEVVPTDAGGSGSTPPVGTAS